MFLYEALRFVVCLIAAAGLHLIGKADYLHLVDNCTCTNPKSAHVTNVDVIFQLSL